MEKGGSETPLPRPAPRCLGRNDFQHVDSCQATSLLTFAAERRSPKTTIRTPVTSLPEFLPRRDGGDEREDEEKSEEEALVGRLVAVVGPARARTHEGAGGRMQGGTC